jgi:hypothetical protein
MASGAACLASASSAARSSFSAASHRRSSSSATSRLSGSTRLNWRRPARRHTASVRLDVPRLCAVPRPSGAEPCGPATARRARRAPALLRTHPPRQRPPAGHGYAGRQATHETADDCRHTLRRPCSERTSCNRIGRTRRCRPAGQMADFVASSATSGALVGICPACNRLMYRRVSVARLSEVAGALDVHMTRAQPRIEDTAIPNVICHLRA